MNKKQRLEQIRKLAIEGCGRPTILRLVPETTEWEVRKELERLRKNIPENITDEQALKLVAPARINNFNLLSDLKPVVVKVRPNKKLKPKASRSMKIMIAVGDTHGQYVDKKALDVACQIISDINPDLLVHLGDLGDFYSISRFDKNPLRKQNLQFDAEEAGKVLGKLDQAIGKHTRKILVEGNHEDRLKRFIWNTAPALANLRGLNIPSLVGAKELGWEYIEQDLEVFPNFLIKHGVTSSKHAGYTAKREVERNWMSGVSGHTHKLALACYTPRKNQINNDPPVIWVENGCLCDTNAEFLKQGSNWQQGFSIFRFEGKRVYPELIPIFDGKSYFNGKLYSS